jgi:glutathione S-transferase
MIRLHQYPPMFGIPNPSPFCLKLETWLRMTGMPFEIVRVVDPRKGPKGKVPWIEDRGRTIDDSSFIIEYLAETYGNPLDGNLAPAQRATALALQRLIEDHLYWAIAHGRFLDDEVWPTTKAQFLAGFPAPLRPLVGRLVRKTIGKALHMQGLGRHTQEDLYRLECDDLTALSTFLGDQQYFFGDKPTELDATAYGFLAQIMWAPGPRRGREHLQQTHNLPAFCERVRRDFYGGNSHE